MELIPAQITIVDNIYLPIIIIVSEGCVDLLWLVLLSKESDSPWVRSEVHTLTAQFDIAIIAVCHQHHERTSL